MIDLNMSSLKWCSLINCNVCVLMLHFITNLKIKVCVDLLFR